MKFTLSWLKEFLDTNADLKTITDKLTEIGLELESIENPADKLRDFVVAYILDARPHPDADKLQICTVDNGVDKLQIVCGAANARAGIYVVLAPVGTTIPSNNLKIKAAKIRGIDSNGMLCSAEELGLSCKSEGIIEVEASANDIGKKYYQVANLDDPIIDIAVTPNRGDCLGVYGIARDLSAAGIGRLKPINLPSISEDISNPLTVSVSEASLCPKFIYRYFSNVQNKPSPSWLKNRLNAVGVNSVSALVDITNYISLSFARPLHVYDADKINGSLTVRKARDGEIISALNNKSYNLTASDLIVADTKEPVALAGIIGNVNSSCSLDTKNVLLEIALFDRNIVAESGRRLDILTDSRSRFERGIDPNFMEQADLIASGLILSLCGGQASKEICINNLDNKPKLLDFNYNLVEKLTGIKTSPEKISEILIALGFNSKEGVFEVPSWRNDVTCTQDLVEEFARIYGYSHIPTLSLPKDNNLLQDNSNGFYSKLSNARISLVEQGLSEVITWSFMSSKKASLFTDIKENLKLLNPISSELDYLRPSAIPNLLDAIVSNNSRGYQDLGLFELGNNFTGTKPENHIYTTSGIRCGKAICRNVHEASRDVDIFDAKGDVFAALTALNIPTDSLKCDKSALPYYHPGKSGTLKLGKDILAYFGQIHPTILKRFSIEIPVVAFEIFINNIPAAKAKSSFARKNLVLSNYQSSTRDFAFIIDEKISADEILKPIQKLDKNLIEEVIIFDIYKGKNVESGKKSIAFSVRIRAQDRTLTDNELDSLSNKIIETVAKLGGSLR